jgi:hypothetical protein
MNSLEPTHPLTSLVYTFDVERKLSFMTGQDACENTVCGEGWEGLYDRVVVRSQWLLCRCSFRERMNAEVIAEIPTLSVYRRL